MNDIILFLLLGLAIANVALLAALYSQSKNNKAPDISLYFANLEHNLERAERVLKDEISRSRSEAAANDKGLTDSLLRRMAETSQTQLMQLETFAKQLAMLTAANEQKLDALRTTIERQLATLQEDNNKKLEQMRATVDEKLHATLEQRLGESFKLVSERLELVHKGLGEMQTLASGVGDLKRVLTNVKTRGIWGEVQLGQLLEQILTADQYSQNIATKPGSNDRVEFAIRLPGRDKDGSAVWLPIDAKFPQEDYQRLLDAQDQANPVLAEEAAKALENRIKLEAKNIAGKYVSPPATTEFAVLFLPTEGLYAEALRRPGLYDTLLRDYRIVLSGPTTLAAFLNSLQMGFRTLAVEKRSSEVWTLLGAVKTEFGKFGTLLDQTHKKLQAASNSIDVAARKSRTIERKLKRVEELPAEEAAELLGSLDELDEVSATEETQRS